MIDYSLLILFYIFNEISRSTILLSRSLGAPSYISYRTSIKSEVSRSMTFSLGILYFEIE